jgi:hypothetical protein
MKKREEVHRMAEANKAFSHYRSKVIEPSLMLSTHFWRILNQAGRNFHKKLRSVLYIKI